MKNSKNLQDALDQERRIAEHCFVRGDARRALPHFRRALLVEPDSDRIEMRVAQCLDRLGKLDESYAAFRALVERGVGRCEEPLRREILQAFTNLCHRLNRDPEVIECLSPHLPLLEQTPPLYYNLGLAFYKCNRLEESKECFERIKAIHANHSAGYIGLAVLYCHFGHLESAIQELQAARAAAPNDVQVVENLAVVQMKIGNPLAAVTTLRSALSKGGGFHSPKFYHLLGVAHLRLGELARAEGYLQKSLAIERTSEALREMGWLQITRGNFDGSIAYLKDALALNPNDVWAKLDLAIAYFKQGITMDAQVLFNEARAVSPTPEVTRLLDDLARAIETAPRP
ncbi:MAG: hypothetical protein A3G34_00590 [Candidatus Lindowbacteria bacterium RIFCSPLOWO2_12_FULL_62_27]|nr:MAG: hypothetical protein A3G34_00590 [Candidatus Lindowbacteria bacterium RIFCSPLOWO2_12_FULL_62_27]OGH58187.1 MAG: hypothetical protein A3I06_00960 [Candidatus Lindowbacteria bacterium RIFCSPLOWO2_02_FULL_62_12]